ncbi:hypothetical protein BU26DRAFT_142904 [Trematosphaeria pertusa]|uniref:Uncharacterized protein n=1 Tax=Trematosphaeria pertusa TaxID=390896 RepID=A0A6A6IZS2_9PLEO|nr:uncharacterized protein BU26DRAFT_142904 [Trematosphaeria pertusa]KAF2254653.1 hypothetical protein BU26DRAFT_142904 [Trematosphaeria pertusa]
MPCNAFGDETREDRAVGLSTRCSSRRLTRPRSCHHGMYVNIHRGLRDARSKGRNKPLERVPGLSRERNVPARGDPAERICRQRRLTRIDQARMLTAQQQNPGDCGRHAGRTRGCGLGRYQWQQWGLDGLRREAVETRMPSLLPWCSRAAPRVPSDDRVRYRRKRGACEDGGCSKKSGEE